MANNRLSKTDELADILDEYRAKKKAKKDEHPEGETPMDAPTVAIDPKTRLNLPENAPKKDAEPADQDTEPTEVSEETAMHFSDSDEQESLGVSSHFADNPDGDDLPEGMTRPFDQEW